MILKPILLKIFKLETSSMNSISLRYIWIVNWKLLATHDNLTSRNLSSFFKSLSVGWKSKQIWKSIYHILFKSLFPSNGCCHNPRSVKRVFSKTVDIYTITRRPCITCFIHKIVVSFPTLFPLYHSFKNDKLKNETEEDILSAWLLKRIMKGPEIAVLSITDCQFINKAHSEPTPWESWRYNYLIHRPLAHIHADSWMRFCSWLYEIRRR